MSHFFNFEPYNFIKMIQRPQKDTGASGDKKIGFYADFLFLSKNI